MIKSEVGGEVALVSFELPSAVSAATVSLCGDFNDWSPDAQPLAQLEGGGFRALVELPIGRRWRFRYLLDGQRWENDWAADDYIPNDFGTQDSVVDLTDAVLPLPSTPPMEVADTAAAEVEDAAATEVAATEAATPETATPETTTPEAATPETATESPAVDSPADGAPLVAESPKTPETGAKANGRKSSGATGAPARTRKRVAAEAGGSPTAKTRARMPKAPAEPTSDTGTGATASASPTRRRRSAKPAE